MLIDKCVKHVIYRVLETQFAICGVEYPGYVELTLVEKLVEKFPWGVSM